MDVLLKDNTEHWWLPPQRPSGSTEGVASRKACGTWAGLRSGMKMFSRPMTEGGREARVEMHDILIWPMTGEGGPYSDWQRRGLR